MNKPYVISAELDLAGTKADKLVKGQQLDAFRQSLDSELRSYGKTTEWVSSSVLAAGLAGRLGRTRLPVASLDDRYVRGGHYLHGHFQGS